MLLSLQPADNQLGVGRAAGLSPILAWVGKLYEQGFRQVGVIEDMEEWQRGRNRACKISIMFCEPAMMPSFSEGYSH